MANRVLSIRNKRGKVDHLLAQITDEGILIVRYGNGGVAHAKARLQKGLDYYKRYSRGPNDYFWHKYSEDQHKMDVVDESVVPASIKLFIYLLEGN